jgi:TRAP-type C4-dicarboxylate transport system permease small subunit
MMDRWDQLDEIIGRVEQLILAAMLSLMILVAFLQIMLRNFFATGLSWGDPLVRYLVLWAGFAGAALATKEGKHIKIDVFSLMVPGLGSTVILIITNLFSFFVCGLLTFAALIFVQNEALIGGTTFLGIPTWIPQIIIPVSFGIMTLRFGFRSMKICYAMLNPAESKRKI